MSLELVSHGSLSTHQAPWAVLEDDMGATHPALNASMHGAHPFFLS